MSATTTKKLAASFAILAAVGAFVSFGVFSAFSETKSNSSSLKSAAFALVQTPSSGLLGTITGLIPGDVITRCVKLKNDGDINAAVVVDPGMTNTTGTLVSQLTVTLQEVASMADPTNASQCAAAASDGLGYVIGSAGTPLSGTAFGALANQSLGTWAAGATHYYRAVISLPSSVASTIYAGNEVAGSLDFIATQSDSGSAR